MDTPERVYKLVRNDTDEVVSEHPTYGAALRQFYELGGNTATARASKLEGEPTMRIDPPRR